MAKKEKSKTTTATSFTKEISPESGSFELIRWDRATKWFVGICLFLYLISVLGKFHFSSIPLWNQIVNDGSSLKKGLVKGTPKTMRSDEWLVQTPFIIAQTETGYKVENLSLGASNTPLLINLPIQNYLSYIRIQHWLFHLSGKEIGFSWYMNFRVFGLLISVFFILMIITKNDFWLSCIGSIFTFFSSFLIWWSSHNEEIIFAMFSVTLFLYLINSKYWVKSTILAILLFLSLSNFILILYPPYQIPVVFVSSCIIIGYLLDNKLSTLTEYKDMIVRSLIYLVPLCILLSVTLYYFYILSKETLDLIMGTVYPGKRFEVGGGYNMLDVLRGTFFPFVSENSVPKIYGNICEYSSPYYLGLFSIGALPLMYIQKVRISSFYLLSSILFLIFVTYQIIGIPEFLSKITLLYMVPSYRITYGLGILNILLFFSSLNYIYKLTSLHKFLVLLFISFILIVTQVVYGKSYFEGFFTSHQVFISFLIFIVIGCLGLFYYNHNFIKIFFLVSLLILSSFNFNVHPISKGLAPLTDNVLAKYVKSLPEDVKRSKWLVYGQFTFPNLLKANGINCINGVNFVPNFKDLNILDPTSKYDSVYNRYAHISYYPNYADSLKFTLIQSDSYAISIDPCSDKLRQMGVSYIMFTYPPSDFEKRCLEQLPNTNFQIFKLK